MEEYVQLFILVERIVRAERGGGMKERRYSCSGMFIHVLYIVKEGRGEG